MERTIFAPREWVVYAWRDPSVLAEWFCPNPSTSVIAELRVEAGGSWKVAMGPMVVRGEYTEVQLPDRLAFTWQWEHEPDVRPTTVRVTFSERSQDSTEVLLEHLDFQDLDEAEGHQQGWNITLDRLAQVVASRMAASAELP
jgi:uncharacterized protein YndB with AHSA1/START domain